MKIGDLVRFVDQTGHFPGLEGAVALVVENHEWGTIVEWMDDGTRDDTEFYASQCPFTKPEAWWRIVSYVR